MPIIKYEHDAHMQAQKMSEFMRHTKIYQINVYELQLNNLLNKHAACTSNYYTFTARKCRFFPLSISLCVSLKIILKQQKRKKKKRKIVHVTHANKQMKANQTTTITAHTHKKPNQTK